MISIMAANSPRTAAPLTLALLLLSLVLRAEEAAPLKLVQTIPLADVKGRFDHFALDVKGRRLFVAALGNDTVEVLDLSGGKRAHTINGLRKPQGVAYLPEANQLVVASGGDGTCRLYDAA